MRIQLMYITNKPQIARIAENAGVDWIFVDLETIGKEQRQRSMNSVISRHSLDDIKTIKQALKRAKLLVRINPLHEGSGQEISRAIANGANIIMLPFFKTAQEAAEFISLVNGRAETCLLLETPEAVQALDSVLELPGIDYIHIGLNDLHLGYKMKFMFEPLADGTVEAICDKIKNKGICCGFGGIARIGQGEIPSQWIIAEHCRLGSVMAILSRTFCDTDKLTDLAEIERIFTSGIRDIRACEAEMRAKPPEFLEENRLAIQKKVAGIASARTNGAIRPA